MNSSTPREPIFNVPGVLVATIGALVVIHALRSLLSQEAEVEVLLLFAFIPARYDANILANAAWPGGTAADIWTFVTYALLHADWMHLLFNSVWFLAFGTPLARRFGAARFLAFCAVTAAAGALAHLVTHFGQMVPMVGASGAISGAMSGAMRFAFQRGGPLTFGGAHHSYRVPALSLVNSFRDPRVLAFLAVWFGLNLLFGLGSISITGNEQPVAWQAHVGGFLAGLLLFSWFDPVGSAPERDDRPAA
ncbi:rhomboid family intramembrane serine protease [Pseudorhodoplanes sp.]|uniref:rhomboid family intramembrane serine protease n=1 Tax=Pseudorhodoplanes sp. TaxID=1934341 RepID=UPI002CEABA25|nr:rhomboid family intramembrane serine protease [Pseudorhodoplanes sp.]HWV54537.1 rhomboid family intramembrane serine protease [Pseudorhodoplanes sp.]